MLIKRIYDQEEYEIALSIRKKVFIEEQNVNKTIEIDEYENTSIHFLAYYNDKPVGTGRFRTISSLEASPQYKGFLKFERIATLREARNQGIGSALMQYMIKVAKENFPDYLPILYAQEGAVGFYQKLGWNLVGETFLEANIIHQKMTLPH